MFPVAVLVFAWMSMTGEENPFYEYYDEILDICREYDVTISLEMPAVRDVLPMLPMSARLRSLYVLGELTKRAWEKCTGYG